MPGSLSLSRSRRGVPATPPPSGSKEQALVPVSCPDCFGVLHFEREGPNGHLIYRCQVDHRYGIGSLLQAKETQLERTLWSAVLLLHQTVLAYEDYLAELGRHERVDRRHIQRRIQEVRRQCLAIRAMIEASHAME